MTKCPFPGMDPFIENEDWQDFHLMLTAEIKRQLAPQLPPHYRLTAELSVKEVTNGGDSTGGGPTKGYIPDLGILRDSAAETMEVSAETSTLTLAAPSRHIMSAPSPKQRELRIRDTRNNRLVTAIEVLSPSNKYGDGWVNHRRKVEAYREGQVNVIDIDLLRGGGYSFGIVGSGWYAPEEDGHREAYCVALYTPEGKISVWDIALTDELPRVPVPLTPPDEPVALDLQRAFTELYAYSTYPQREAESLEKISPPLSEEERERLRSYLMEAAKTS